MAGVLAGSEPQAKRVGQAEGEASCRETGTRQQRPLGLVTPGTN